MFSVSSRKAQDAASAAGSIPRVVSPPSALAIGIAVATNRTIARSVVDHLDEVLGKRVGLSPPKVELDSHTHTP